MAHTFRSIAARTSSSANGDVFSFLPAARDTVWVLMIKVVGATNRAGGAPSIHITGTTPPVLTFQQANSTQKATTAPEASAELWYITNPPLLPVGGNTSLTIPNTGVAAMFYTFAAGQAQEGMGSAFDGANGANTGAVDAANPNPGAIVTTGIGDIVFAITAGGWTTWVPTAQVGTIIANTDDGAHGGGEQYTIQASAGSISLGWTFATVDDWGAVAAAFKEVPLNQVPNNYQSISAETGNTGILSTGERIR
jgi:hypothetical protein